MSKVASVSDSHPVRASLEAARANLGPGLALQAFALALLAAYTWHGPTRSALEKLAVFRAETGLPLAIVSTAVFGALLPCAVLRLRAATRDRFDRRQIAALTAFWAYKGVEVSFLYEVQAALFGETADFATVALKTTFDQAFYGPVFSVPVTWCVYAWVEGHFAVRPLFARIRSPGWYLRDVLPILVASSGVWTPAVVIIYMLPTPLQLPMQNIVLCFYTLMVMVMSARPRKPATTKNA